MASSIRSQTSVSSRNSPLARPTVRKGSSIVTEVVRRQRNQRGEGERLRDEVFEAAMRILDRAPATVPSLRQIASEVGVAAPSLYRRFPSAEEMMKEIVQQCWRQVGQAVAEAGQATGSEPPLKRLQAQMGAYVHYAMVRPSRYQLLYAPHINLEDEQEGPVRPISVAARTVIEEHIAAGGKAPNDDPLSATVLVLSLVHGRIALAHLAPARPGNSPTAVDEFVRLSLESLFR